MTNIKKLQYILFAFVACLVVITCGILGSLTVYAATYNYTDALEDLQKDSSFNANDYALNTTNYSLQVIQVAESEAKELFIYVYQPSGQNGDLTATSISMSSSIGDSFSPKVYALTKLNSNGVFFKYKVNDFELKSDVVRYYEIVEIWRKWNSDFDEPSENSNTIEEVTFEVAQLWTACTLNGIVSYTMTETEVIKILNPYKGFIRYSNGFTLNNSSCDSHYIAFSTDRQIDKLLGATVYYESKLVKTLNSLVSEGEAQDCYATLTYDQRTSNPAHGLFAKKYSWQRIQSAADFIASEDLKDDVKSNISKTQWVLRFAETEYTHSGGPMGLSGSQDSYTTVTSVSILRLTFETDGKVYNLGTVMNKVAGNTTPDNNNTNEFDFSISGFASSFSTLKLLLGLLVLIIILVMFSPIIVTLVDYVIKFVLWIVKLLIKLIGKLSKARSRRKVNKQAKRNETNYDYLDEYDWDSDFWSDIDGME
jgi:hypothetical protein